LVYCPTYGRMRISDYCKGSLQSWITSRWMMKILSRTFPNFKNQLLVITNWMIKISFLTNVFKVNLEVQLWMLWNFSPLDDYNFLKIYLWWTVLKSYWKTVFGVESGMRLRDVGSDGWLKYFLKYILMDEYDLSSKYCGKIQTLTNQW